jgi:hypothetical protein
MTQVNFVDITHSHAQQTDDTASSGEQIHTISHTILSHSNTNTWI